MPIPKGTIVRQVVPVIEGEVTERRFNEDTDEMQYHVVYKDADGNDVARWFDEPQIEVVE